MNNQLPKLEFFQYVKGLLNSALNLSLDSRLKPADVVRYRTIILDNLEYIANKRIVDFCALTGHLGFIALHNSATSVIATEIRPVLIDIIKLAAEYQQYSTEQFQIVKSNIHDYVANKEICAGADTVLLCGIMYHVHDHVAILESVASADPSCIIIETLNDTNISYMHKPLISWKTENTNSLFTAASDKFDKVLVGFPNPAWFDLVMNWLGYSKRNQRDYVYSMEYDVAVADKIQNRTVLVYTKSVDN